MLRPFRGEYECARPRLRSLVYPSVSTAWRTRCRTSVETDGSPFRTRLTVPSETDAVAATSLTVIGISNYFQNGQLIVEMNLVFSNQPELSRTFQPVVRDTRDAPWHVPD